MDYFYETVETITEGVGFSHFDTCHFIWLAGFILFTCLCCILYKKSSPNRRKTIRWIFVAMLFANELYKIIGLVAYDNYIPKYLPLQLCSINIFVIAAHAFKPSKAIGNFLYAICIPGALAALVFPSWTELPAYNFMHIHSFTIHIMLAAYPIMLTAGGDIKPNIGQIPKCLALLVGMAIPVYFVNLMFDTNFMFLMQADVGNPLMWFENAFGNHLIGYPILAIPILIVLYFPVWINNRKKLATYASPQC